MSTTYMAGEGNQEQIHSLEPLEIPVKKAFEEVFLPDNLWSVYSRSREGSSRPKVQEGPSGTDELTKELILSLNDVPKEFGSHEGSTYSNPLAISEYSPLSYTQIALLAGLVRSKFPKGIDENSEQYKKIKELAEFTEKSEELGSNFKETAIWFLDHAHQVLNTDSTSIGFANFEELTFIYRARMVLVQTASKIKHSSDTPEEQIVSIV